MKRCTCCRSEFPASNDHFHRNRSKKDGFSDRCKECAKHHAKKWALENPAKKAATDKDYAKRNQEKISRYQAEYRSNNADEAKAYNKQYREKNHSKLKEKRREYNSKPEVKKRRRDRQRERRRSDRRYALICNMRSAISECVSGRKKGAFRNVDWGADDLLTHIERQFQPGMSWDNYGEWHIDHIVPLSSFNFCSDKDEGFKQCWSLSNLRPLWAEENCRKSDNITHLL